LLHFLPGFGHPQLATPLKTDNSTSNSFVHANIKQRRSKTWDMRWNWLRDKSLRTINYVPTGTKGKTTTLIISRNITHRRITSLCAQDMFSMHIKLHAPDRLLGARVC
jgi:hypothetical protein